MPVLRWQSRCSSLGAALGIKLTATRLLGIRKAQIRGCLIWDQEVSQRRVGTRVYAKLWQVEESTL